MDKKKKRTALIAAALSVLLLTPAIVLAIVLNSEERVNTFRPADQEIQIAENDGDYKETQDNSLAWSEKDNGGYTAQKSVEIGEFSNPNGEFVRVRFVPTWYDDTGCIVSGIDGVTDIRSAELSDDNKMLLFKDGKNEPETVVTLNLAENWDELWTYDADNQCFVSIQVIKSGDEINLLSSVEVSNTVLTAAETAKVFLKVEVLADSVQAADDGTNPKW